MRRGLTFVLGTAFGLALVATCGTDFRLAGGVKDAGASTLLTAECSLEQVRVLSSPALVQKTTTYYASLEMPSLDPTKSPTVSVAACDSERFGPEGGGCPPGYTCADSGYAIDPSLNCTTGSYAQIGPGKILVACGSKVEVTYADTPASNTVSGSRATRVYVSVN